MANQRKRTLTSLNVVMDEQTLELVGMKKDLQNLNKKVDDKFNIITVQLNTILNAINQFQDSGKGKEIIHKLLNKRPIKTFHLV